MLASCLSLHKIMTPVQSRNEAKNSLFCPHFLPLLRAKFVIMKQKNKHACSKGIAEDTEVEFSKRHIVSTSEENYRGGMWNEL